MKNGSTFEVGFAGGLVAALLLVGAPAIAATGSSLLLGKDNDAGNSTTKLEANVATGPGLKVSNTGGGQRAALRVDVGCPATDSESKEECSPPFASDTSGKVKHFNADKVDGLHSGELIDAAVAAGPTLDVATSEQHVDTASQSFTDVEDMSISVDVPPGEPRHALVTFSAANRCIQSPLNSVICRIRVLADGEPIASSTGLHFNSVQQGANDSAETTWAYATHSVQLYSELLKPGPHTLTVQFRVDEADSVFTLAWRTLSVQTFPQ